MRTTLLRCYVTALRARLLMFHVVVLRGTARVNYSMAKEGGAKGYDPFSDGFNDVAPPADHPNTEAQWTLVLLLLGTE